MLQCKCIVCERYLNIKQTKAKTKKSEFYQHFLSFFETNNTPEYLVAKERHTHTQNTIERPLDRHYLPFRNPFYHNGGIFLGVSLINLIFFYMA